MTRKGSPVGRHERADLANLAKARTAFGKGRITHAQVIHAVGLCPCGLEHHEAAYIMEIALEPGLRSLIARARIRVSLHRISDHASMARWRKH